MPGIVERSRMKSPWLFHINTGSCNGCDIEIVAALTPRYDAERLGCVLVGSPKHADVILVTGPVTRQMYSRLMNVYKQARALGTSANLAQLPGSTKMASERSLPILESFTSKAATNSISPI